MATFNGIGAVPLAVLYGGTGTTTSSGSGNPVFATSPTLVTPTLGVCTATSLAFSPTTGGIVGCGTNNNASTGYVGETFESVVLQSSAISVTTGNTADITSITVSAGDYDVFGNIWLGATTTISTVKLWTSTSSATAPDESLLQFSSLTGTVTSFGLSCPYLRVNVSSSTTIYLSILPVGTGTLTAAGRIYARRMR